MTTGMGGVATAMAAVAGVILAAECTFFTVLLWRATKVQAGITSEVFEVSHRLYLSFRMDDWASCLPGGMPGWKLV